MKKGASKRVKKLQFTRIRVVLHEVSSPTSLASRKRNAFEIML